MSSRPPAAPQADRAAAAAAALARGAMIVVHDERVCVAAIRADAVTPDVVADLARDARGLVAVAMAPERVDALGLRSLGAARSDMPEFTVSVDALEGTTTGISAADRAATIHALRATRPDAGLGVPGHIQPIRAAAGGTFERPGFAEACVDLARMAGVEPVVATCEILGEGGDALAPDALSGHPVFGRAPVVSAVEVHRHRRGLATGTPPLAREHFARAMSALVAGVAAVTVRDEDGAPRGMLATAVSSFSDRPPSLLVSVAHSSRTHDPLVSAAGFGLHLLGAGQDAVAAVLADKGDDKFASLEWSWDGDVPRLHGVLGYLRCARSTVFQHHDHTIVIGDVELVELQDGSPLVYYQRALGWRLDRREAA